MCFSGEDYQLPHVYIRHEISISYIKLDHTLSSINYGNCKGLMHKEKIQADMLRLWPLEGEDAWKVHEGY